MPLFDLYKQNLEELTRGIDEALGMFSKHRPDIVSEQMTGEPKLVDPSIDDETSRRPVIAVDGGSGAVHFRWVSVSAAHSVAAIATLAEPSRWTIPAAKDNLVAFSLYRENIHRINDYIRSCCEVRTALDTAKKYRADKPIVLMDGSLANTYRFLARAPPQRIFTDKRKLISGDRMKAHMLALLESGVDIVAVSKDTRVKFLPGVERKTSKHHPGAIVVADPIEFAGKDVIDRRVITFPPYIWLIFVRFTDLGRVFRVEIALRNEKERDPERFVQLLSLLRATVDIDEPRTLQLRRLGYPYPLACVDAIARVGASDSQWVRHQVENVMKRYYPHLEPVFGVETGEMVHAH